MQIRFGVNKRLEHGSEHKVRSLSDTFAALTERLLSN